MGNNMKGEHSDTLSEEGGVMSEYSFATRAKEESKENKYLKLSSIKGGNTNAGNGLTGLIDDD